MIDIEEINETIKELENSDTNWKNCEKLSILYNIRDKIGNGQGNNQSYSSRRVMTPMYSNSSDGEKLTREDAESWVEHMENADGSTGPRWSMEQTNQIVAQRSLEGSPLLWWVALNATYSDLCKVFKKLGINNVDAYVDVAKAFWMEDKDAVSDKLLAYYNSVVKH